MIGYSLSSCVYDILLGKVKEADVEVILAGTRCPDKLTFEQVLAGYSETYWSKTPAKARAIARRLWKRGKIIQPRLLGLEAPNVAGQHYWGATDAQGRDILAEVRQAQAALVN